MNRISLKEKKEQSAEELLEKENIYFHKMEDESDGEKDSKEVKMLFSKSRI